MKRFEVNRTSDLWNDNPPCDEATRITVTKTSGTTRSRLDEFAHAPWAERWFTEGYDHQERRRGKGMVFTKKTDHDIWVVELPDLDALMDFASAYGHIVVCSSEYDGIDGYIEIYDDYRE